MESPGRQSPPIPVRTIYRTLSSCPGGPASAWVPRRWSERLLRSNLIVNAPAAVCGHRSSVPIVARRNKLVNNTIIRPFHFPTSQSGDTLLLRYGCGRQQHGSAVITAFTNSVLAGSMTGPNAWITQPVHRCLYVDPAALAKTNYWPAPITHPLRWLATFTDNGPGDLDPARHHFTFNLSSLVWPRHLCDRGSHLFQRRSAANTDRAVTGPTAFPSRNDQF